MRFIGLTGGIATGKSTVAALLAARGAAIVDADVAARDVVRPGSPALQEIVAAFGQGVLTPAGDLDRAAMAADVFSDAGRRRTLEGIIHPRIATLMAERFAVALAGPAPLVVADIPLLFENGRQAMFDGTLLVYAPPAEQVSRMVRRDGISPGAAHQRLAAQLPIDEKRALATWVLDNGGTPAATAAQLAQWWDEIVKPSGGHPVDQQ